MYWKASFKGKKGYVIWSFIDPLIQNFAQITEQTNFRHKLCYFDNHDD